MPVNYYDGRNCVVEQGKVVYIESKMVRGNWYHIVGAGATIYYSAYQHTRRCQCRYTYTGMDSTTADSCVAAMKSKYTRTQYFSKWNNDTGVFELISSGTNLMANIEKIYNGCDQWNVIVDVYEYDEMWTRTYTTPSFSWCVSRDYYPTPS